MIKNLWNKYSNITEGRACRKDMWIILGLFLAVGIVSAITIGIGTAIHSAVGIAVAIAWFVALIATAWMSLVIQVRRIRDFGYSGWWMLGLVAIGMINNALFPLDPFTGLPYNSAFWIWPILNLFVFYCIRGNVGRNTFGDDVVG